MSEINRPALDWLLARQGVSLSADRAAEAAKSADRLGAVAQAAAASLPFDTDPTGFRRAFNVLARRSNGG